MRVFFISHILLLFSISGYAQKSLSIKKATREIIIDGELNEADWLNANKAIDFQQQYPSDSIKALSKSEVMITFDDKNLYIAAICYDDFPQKKYNVQSLKRDFDLEVSDYFAIYLDPFNDNVNGFGFVISPLGVQSEGLIQGGSNYEKTWDNKWISKVKQYSNKWTIEIKIPFKTIRYNNDLSTWGINFVRNNLKVNEISTWSPVPLQFNANSLAFTGQLKWNEKPKKAGTNIALIPYTAINYKRDFTESSEKIEGNVGFDAKIAVTSSLNLDITVNPDFSQAEVDQQVTNLSRFSLFFPERRQFFIENSDLFGRFGFSKIRPFFSRRIGLDNGNIIPIIAGARLSGKLNNKLRVGALNMQTEGVSSTIDAPSIKAQNFSTVVAQQTIGKRSTLDAIFVNRQGFNDKNIDYNDYNRILGLDYLLRTADNRWIGKVFYHKSFTPNLKKHDFANASFLRRDTKNLQLEWNHEYVGKNYRADVGFVPRISQYNTITNEIVYNTYWRLETAAEYRFFTKSSSKIRNYTIESRLSEYWDNEFNETERKLDITPGIRFYNQSALFFMFTNNDVRLFFPTDVTFSDKTPIAAGKYEYNSVRVFYRSSRLSPFYCSGFIQYGDYFIGNRFNVDAEFSYRTQPWGIFGLNLNVNEIIMPEGYDNASLFLIGPKIELSFTKKLFLSSFIQYNTQAKNMNINTRLQYRFKPMSDLFIVYTDNYNTPNIFIKNRALILKFVYWINT